MSVLEMILTVLLQQGGLRRTERLGVRLSRCWTGLLAEIVKNGKLGIQNMGTDFCTNSRKLFRLWSVVILENGVCVFQQYTK